MSPVSSCPNKGFFVFLAGRDPCRLEQLFALQMRKLIPREVKGPSRVTP